MCFPYQYLSTHELNNQGVALHLFRTSKYIGKIRLSNSIHTFFHKYEFCYCYIMFKISDKYCLLMKNGANKKSLQVDNSM